MGVKRILTPLDAHLDTRLGTIARLSQVAAERVISNPEYWTRENEAWEYFTQGLVTDEQFNEAYAERGGVNTHATLGASVRTSIAPFLLKLLTDDNINRLNQMGDPDDVVCLSVNYWPYNLSDNELEWLRDIMHEMYGQTTMIELISVSMEELSPGFLNENFAACVMYEFHEWIKMHAVALSDIRINCFNFIGPKIFEADVSQLSIDAKVQILNSFRMTKLLHMDFEFIDAKYFSVFNVHGADRADRWTTDEERHEYMKEQEAL